MPALKFLSIVGNRVRELAGVVVSAGALDDGKLLALDASGKIDPSVLPLGVGQNTRVAPASEALLANDLINFWNDGGTVRVRKADGAAEGKEVTGFVKDAVANGANATVYLTGNVMTGLSGLTPGTKQFLSAAVAGQRTETPPAASGNVFQVVGWSVDATSIVFEPEEPITRA